MRLLNDLFGPPNPLIAAEREYYRKRDEIAASLIREKAVPPAEARIRAASIMEMHKRNGIDNETP